MSDSPDDELASAFLDDEVTPEERARVDGDDALQARVEQLRSARDALSSEPSEAPSATTREAAIRAALDASNVVNLSSRRARRGLRIASIAAAVLLVLGAAGLLIRAQSDTKADHFTTAAAPLSPTTTIIPQAERAATGAAATAGDAVGPFGSLNSLGSFTDRSALIAAARTQARDTLSDRKSATTSAPPNAGAAGGGASSASSRCVVPGPPDSTNEVYAASAILDERSVQVDVFTMTDGSLRLVVTDTASCSEVFSQSV